MASHVPPESFAYYLGLGSKRSYEAVAEHFDVSKTAVTNIAVAEGWQARIEAHEKKIRESTEAKVVETLEQMTERHVKIVRAIQSRALQALQSLPIHSGFAAVRSLEAAVKLERVIRGEPGERSAVSVEDTVRREYSRWFDAPPDDDATQTTSDVTEGKDVDDEDA